MKLSFNGRKILLPDDSGGQFWRENSVGEIQREKFGGTNSEVGRVVKTLVQPPRLIRTTAPQRAICPAIRQAICPAICPAIRGLKTRFNLEVILLG